MSENAHADAVRSGTHRVVLQAQDVQVAYTSFTEAGPQTLKRLVTRNRRRIRREVHAVRGVTLTAHEGESVGLIGPNGSGKTTLLRACAGLLPVTAGEVLVSSVPVLLGVGAALQPEISARRNVYLGGTALGLTNEQVDEAFDEIVHFAGVEDFMDLPLRAFSSGMAARLRFSIATAVSPDILMIDEALAVGDQEFRRRSRERMESLLGEARTIFLVSHSLAEVERVCQRAIWIDHGRIVLDGPADDVIAAYRAEAGQD